MQSSGVSIYSPEIKDQYPPPPYSPPVWYHLHVHSRFSTRRQSNRRLSISRDHPIDCRMDEASGHVIVRLVVCSIDIQSHNNYILEPKILNTWWNIKPISKNCRYRIVHGFHFFLILLNKLLDRNVRSNSFLVSISTQEQDVEHGSMRTQPLMNIHLTYYHSIYIAHRPDKCSPSTATSPSRWWEWLQWQRRRKQTTESLWHPSLSMTNRLRSDRESYPLIQCTCVLREDQRFTMSLFSCRMQVRSKHGRKWWWKENDFFPKQFKSDISNIQIPRLSTQLETRNHHLSFCYSNHACYLIVHQSAVSHPLMLLLLLSVPPCVSVVLQLLQMPLRGRISSRRRCRMRAAR